MLVSTLIVVKNCMFCIISKLFPVQCGTEMM